MRLLALLIPVALVGTFLAVQSKHDHSERIRVVPNAPAPMVVSVREAPRVEIRAPRLRYSTRVQETKSGTVTIDLEGTIAATIEAALQAAMTGLEKADVSTEMSFEVTESLLEAIGELLGEVAVSIDGELELVTKHGAHIRISGDGDGNVTVIDISN